MFARSLPSNVTDKRLIEIATKCLKISTLKINSCYEITDEAFAGLAQHARNLKVLGAYNCKQVTDVGVGKVLRRCGRLSHLNLNSVIRVTSKTVHNILGNLENLRWLRSLDFTHCFDIHGEKLNELSRRRPWLKISTDTK